MTNEEAAVLKALWGALEAQDVSYDDGDNTWIDGHFEKGQLAFNMIARLKLAGYAIVPRERDAILSSIMANVPDELQNRGALNWIDRSDWQNRVAHHLVDVLLNARDALARLTSDTPPSSSQPLASE